MRVDSANKINAYETITKTSKSEAVSVRSDEKYSRAIPDGKKPDVVRIIFGKKLVG